MTLVALMNNVAMRGASYCNCLLIIWWKPTLWNVQRVTCFLHNFRKQFGMFFSVFWNKLQEEYMIILIQFWRHLPTEYTECQDFSPVVRISWNPGTNQRGGGNTRLRVRGRGEPIWTKGRTLWYSRYSTYNLSTCLPFTHGTFSITDGHFIALNVVHANWNKEYHIPDGVACCCTQVPDSLSACKYA